MALVLDTDPDTGAEYVHRDGTVLGVEFAAGRASLLHDDWVALYSLAPELKDVLGEHR